MFEEALNRRARQTLNAIAAVASLDGFYMAGGTGLVVKNSWSPTGKARGTSMKYPPTPRLRRVIHQ
jgi:hypothetical protein